LGGTQDNGTPSYKGNARWGYEVCSDGSWTAMDAQSNPLTAYAACAGKRLVIGKSTLQADGNFGPWANKINNITGGQPNFLPPLIVDPTTANTLFYATDKIWQTTNGGDRWEAVSQGLTAGPESLSTIAFGGKEGEGEQKTTLLAGTTRGRVWISKDVKMGAQWTRIETGLPNRAITQITVDPNRAVAYTTFSGFSKFITTEGVMGGDGKGHVFTATLDSPSISWRDISQGPFGLPDVPVNDIVIDPEVCDTFYVATDIGVFFTADGGLRWQTLPTGLPRAVVMSLKLNQRFRTLRAATHGFSAWDLDVPVRLSGVLLRPVSGSFGQQKVGTTGPKKVFLLTSGCFSKKPFTVSSITASSNDFTIENGDFSCQPFKATTGCLIYVSFTPHSVGKINGLLIVSDNALGSPRSSALAGEGTQ
jgi:hypothetical protein